MLFVQMLLFVFRVNYPFCFFTDLPPSEERETSETTITHFTISGAKVKNKTIISNKTSVLGFAVVFICCPWGCIHVFTLRCYFPETPSAVPDILHSNSNVENFRSHD